MRQLRHSARLPCSLQPLCSPSCHFPVRGRSCPRSGTPGWQPNQRPSRRPRRCWIHRLRRRQPESVWPECTERRCGAEHEWQELTVSFSLPRLTLKKSARAAIRLAHVQPEGRRLRSALRQTWLLAGNPAISSVTARDRRLCVPALRRVCPCVVGLVSPMKKTPASVGSRRQLDVATGKKELVLTFTATGSTRSADPTSALPCRIALPRMCSAF
jgi:hypothetical protein